MTGTFRARRVAYAAAGLVVTRINLSTKFMKELLDAMQDSYSKWSTREGIRNLPENRDPSNGD